MRKSLSIFGWKAILRNYGWTSFWLDSILPLIVSLGLCTLIYVKDADIILQLKHLVGVGISTVPAMVALILTAYTIIMQTFIIGDKFASIKKTEEGRQLIQDLNSSFAACLFVSTISIIAMIIISSIANMGIAIEEPNTVNYPVYFLVCYLLLYSVSILIGIVIDIFNSGQTTLLDDNNKQRQKTQRMRILLIGRIYFRNRNKERAAQSQIRRRGGSCGSPANCGKDLASAAD